MRCPCGQPLHYTDPALQATIEALVYEFGEHVPVTTPEGTWLVSRHYIALHGLKAEEVPGLGFEKIAGRAV